MANASRAEFEQYIFYIVRSAAGFPGKENSGGP